MQSEHEESKCTGTYTALSDGFTLEFALGDGSYKVTCRDGVNLSVDGLLSYCIDFSAGGEVELKTPFGNIVYNVEPRTSAVKNTERGVEMDLSYALKSETEIIERAVKITATRI